MKMMRMVKDLLFDFVHEHRLQLQRLACPKTEDRITFLCPFVERKTRTIGVTEQDGSEDFAFGMKP